MVLGALLGAQAAAQNNGPDTSGTGTYPAMKEEVAWGHGGCSDDAANSLNHLLELASHGYLVIASGRICSGPGAHPAPAGPKPFPRTPTVALTEAIDWALAENTCPGSPYFGRIDPKGIAVSEFSCGGLCTDPQWTIERKNLPAR